MLNRQGKLVKCVSVKRFSRVFFSLEIEMLKKTILHDRSTMPERQRPRHSYIYNSPFQYSVFPWPASSETAGHIHNQVPRKDFYFVEIAEA